jgi:hypothetical protein
MSAQQALDIARDATSIASATVDPQDPIGRKPGQTVTVTPDDTGRDPVVGELVASDVHEIVIRRSDREIGGKSGTFGGSPQARKDRRSARATLASWPMPRHVW